MCFLFSDDDCAPNSARYLRLYETRYVGMFVHHWRRHFFTAAAATSLPRAGFPVAFAARRCRHGAVSHRRR
jgi:hypothetical protein